VNQLNGGNNSLGPIVLAWVSARRPRRFWDLGAAIMIKTDELPLVHIDFHGDSSEVSLTERDISLEEWDYIRTAAFARLRKEGFIPDALIDLVESHKERSLVQTSFQKTSDKAIRFRIERIDKEAKHDFVRRLAEIIAAQTRIENADQEKSLTASEALAFFLRINLRELKYAEKKHKPAPARTLKLVPRSVIAEIAMDLFASCSLWNYAPGPFLQELFRELLDIESRKNVLPRSLDAQKSAAFIVAQIPAVRTRELARRVQVNPSTISRWRRSSEFNAEVEKAKRTIADLKLLREKSRNVR
jgi:hypothetical protein